MQHRKAVFDPQGIAPGIHPAGRKTIVTLAERFVQIQLLHPPPLHLHTATTYPVQHHFARQRLRQVVQKGIGFDPIIRRSHLQGFNTVSHTPLQVLTRQILQVHPQRQLFQVLCHKAVLQLQRETAALWAQLKRTAATVGFSAGCRNIGFYNKNASKAEGLRRLLCRSLHTYLQLSLSIGKSFTGSKRLLCPRQPPILLSPLHPPGHLSPGQGQTIQKLGTQGQANAFTQARLTLQRQNFYLKAGTLKASTKTEVAPLLVRNIKSPFSSPCGRTKLPEAEP